MNRTGHHFELLPISLPELSELSGASLFRVSEWAAEKALPGFNGNQLTVRDAVLATTMQAFEKAGLSYKLAEAPSAHALHQLAASCRDLYMLSIWLHALQPDCRQIGMAGLAPLISGLNSGEPKQFAFVDTATSDVRMADYRMLSSLRREHGELATFDVREIAAEIASRLKRPLIGLRQPLMPSRSVVLTTPISSSYDIVYGAE
jgi:hypothetical protein